MTPTPLLKVSHLSVNYLNRNSDIVSALNDISFSLEHKQCLGIIGESGSGKSVTLLSLLGLMNTAPGITNGTIEFTQDNNTINLLEKIDTYPLKNISSSSSIIQRQFKRRKEQLDKNYQTIRGKQISIIFQNPKLAFNPFYSIGHQICEMIRLHTDISAKKKVIEKALFWLEKVGMDDPESRFHNNPYGLSGGLCQRAMIAMALASEPSLLIADEPTTGLDTILQSNILNLLHDLQQELNLSMIIVSHDLKVIQALCSNVLVYHSGMIIEKGATNCVLSSSENKHPYTRQLIQCDLNNVCLAGDIIKQHINNSGCPYYNNCDEITSRINQTCSKRTPSLNNLDNEHAIRCWKYHDN